jgi:cardiolipin synthase
MTIAELPWTLLFVASLVGSAAVTVHALLRKRNPTSAAAWIGLAWFAPWIGVPLYLALGINRVERRARRLKRHPGKTEDGSSPLIVEPPHLAPLDVAMTRITGRPCLPGATVEILEGGDAAYPRMLAAIEGAKVSVALTSYIFQADHIGQRFIKALSDAHGRGVDVRVLIDGVGGGALRAHAWRMLRATGTPAQRFLHTTLPWRTPLLNLRSHRKLLIADGAEAFVGGLNIGDENLSAHGLKVRDVHFRVTGPVVAQAMTAFAADWRFAADEDLSGPKWFPELASEGESLARVVTSGPDHELERIKAVLMSAIGAATRQIRIQTPYFIPDELMSAALRLAAMRGIDVMIVIPARSDWFPLEWAMTDGLVPLLASGCRIHRSPPPFDHSKLMTVDGIWCLVGSSNWDQRSLRLNFELDLEVRDTVLAEALDRRIEAAAGSAVTLRGLAARRLWVRLRDAAARLAAPYL